MRRGDWLWSHWVRGQLGVERAGLWTVVGIAAVGLQNGWQAPVVRACKSACPFHEVILTSVPLYISVNTTREDRLMFMFRNGTVVVLQARAKGYAEMH